MGSRADLYGVGVHEILHALGLTTSNFEDFIGRDAGGNAIGTNVMAEYGGPVPLTGGHFDYGTQSVVWDSNGIISEVSLDPNTTIGNRKFLTRLDAAALRDLGYQVAHSWQDPIPVFDVTIRQSGQYVRLNWPSANQFTYTVYWSTDLVNWNEVPIGNVGSWRDSAGIGERRYYYVTREE